MCPVIAEHTRTASQCLKHISYHPKGIPNSSHTMCFLEICMTQGAPLKTFTAAWKVSPFLTPMSKVPCELKKRPWRLAMHL